MAAAPLYQMATTFGRVAGAALGSSLRAAQAASAAPAVRLADTFSKALVDDIFACALKKQTGVSLKYM